MGSRGAGGRGWGESFERRGIRVGGACGTEQVRGATYGRGPRAGRPGANLAVTYSFGSQ